MIKSKCSLFVCNFKVLTFFNFSEALPLGKEKDSHLYGNTSFVGSSGDTLTRILNIKLESI